MQKLCERCQRKLPDDYQNLLCDAHYEAFIAEEAKLKEERLAEEKKRPDSILNTSNTEKVEPASEQPPEEAPEPAKQPEVCDHSDCGISDPNYKENPEADDKDQILANLAQFVYSHRGGDHPRGRKHGILLYYPQRNMYNFIKNYCMKRAMDHPQYPKYLWKPKIVDVGCGSGVGANVMSQEADMVWGIDKNEFSVEFAQEAFTREKNGYYYSSQVTFDVIDIMKDNREFMAFDIVSAIEIIEHVWDVNGFLNNIKRFTKRDKNGGVIRTWPTEFFISTPNRSHVKLQKHQPANPFHVREWSSVEFAALLRKHFENVEILNQKGEPVPEDNDVDQIVFAKCSIPK